MQNHTLKLSRRAMLRTSMQATAALAFASSSTSLLAAAGSRKYKIGACDWSIGKMGNPEAFNVAKEIGLDGVQVSLGTVADDMKLRKASVQEEYKKAAQQTGVE